MSTKRPRYGSDQVQIYDHMDSRFYRNAWGALRKLTAIKVKMIAAYEKADEMTSAALNVHDFSVQMMNCALYLQVWKDSDMAEKSKYLSEVARISAGVVETPSAIAFITWLNRNPSTGIDTILQEYKALDAQLLYPQYPLIQITQVMRALSLEHQIRPLAVQLRLNRLAKTKKTDDPTPSNNDEPTN